MLLSERARSEWLGNPRAELLAGVVVALAVVPEAIAFSIIAGVDPKVGLYISFSIAVLTPIVGGRPGMISAATAATAVLMVTLVRDHGLEYLLAATVIAGLLQILAGIARLSFVMHFDDPTERLRAAYPAIEVQQRLRNGDLIGAIGELEAETRFAIIGKRGEAAGFAREHLGSNLDRAVRSFQRPVLVAAFEFRPIARFLLAYDGSPATERAVERLVEGSVLRGVECHILSVGSPTPAVRHRLQAAGEALRRAGFAVTEHLQAGEPEQVIGQAVLDLDIDLLVLGKSGHSRLRQLAMGSTTLELMRTCRRTVLIFP